MPHLDFRQAFSSASDDAPIAVVSEALDSGSEEITSVVQKRTLATRLPRLHRSDRTTILFAILIFVGGLFCVFYFFNGAEILRAAAAWSREFLYPRPSAQMVSNDKIDISKMGADPQARSADSRSSDPARGSNTSPFAPYLGSLVPPTFNDPSGASATLPPGPGSLLGQLDVPAPGGDALLQSFNQAVENMVRATNLFANNTVIVIRSTVTKVSAKSSAQMKAAKRRRENIIARASAQQSVQNAKQAPNVIDRTQNQAVTSVRDLGQQGLGIQGLRSPGGLGEGMSGQGALGRVNLGMGGH